MTGTGPQQRPKGTPRDARSNTEEELKYNVNRSLRADLLWNASSWRFPFVTASLYYVSLSHLKPSSYQRPSRNHRCIDGHNSVRDNDSKSKSRWGILVSNEYSWSNIVVHSIVWSQIHLLMVVMPNDRLHTVFRYTSS
jgi:hypothetical protein